MSLNKLALSAILVMGLGSITAGHATVVYDGGAPIDLSLNHDNQS